jgi:tetratricopeptide (TPR) repeat protein
MRILLALAVLVAVAHADPDRQQRANDAFLKGQLAYNDGHYAEAIEQFQYAYDLVPDPAYLFNIAQSYRLAKNCLKAAEHYGRFLAKVPNPPKVEKIRAWYDEARACAANQPEPVPAPAPGDPGVGFDGPPPPLMGGTRVEAPPVRVDTPAPSSRRRTLAYGTFALGALALGAAGYFTYDISRIRDEAGGLQCTEAQPCPASEVVELDRRGTRAERLAVAGYVVAGAAVAAGVALVLTGPRLTVTPTGRGALVGRSWQF